MNAKQYQEEAARTLIKEPGFEVPGEEQMLNWCALGLAGETGEVVEHIKKGVFHQHGIDRERLGKELGDVLWYVAGLCSTLDLNLGDVMQANIDKLHLRYPGGFSSEDSKARRDVSPATKRQTDAKTINCQ